MGRGRAKAKQTRVARELKYHSPNTDLDALQRELAGSRKSDSDYAGYGEQLEDEADDEDDGDEDEDEDASSHNNWRLRGR
jgi:regulator of RNase E activity RraB